jgi:serine/threonine-protein kinase RsbT
MQVLKAETLPIHSESDVVRVRQLVRTRALECRFSLVDQTKVVTASSELARNTLIHGKGGKVVMEIVSDDHNQPAGLRLAFEDSGPGIEDVNRALEDGYTTGGGMGLGLPGARRLANEFEISSQPGKGTRVSFVKWRGR